MDISDRSDINPGDGEEPAPAEKRPLPVAEADVPGGVPGPEADHRGENGDPGPETSAAEPAEAVAAGPGPSSPQAEEMGSTPPAGETSALPLKNKVEAVLFVTADPLSLKRLAGIVGDATVAEVREAVAALQRDYAGRGVELVEIAGGYRFFTREEYAPWAKKVVPDVNPSRLSRAALEALSIIAYRQPITKVAIEEIRGCNCDGVIRTLLERKLIVADGQAEMPGRPFLYRTTKYFLEYFGLSDLADLPPLKEAATPPPEE